jgi:hypothetical protein
MFYKSISTLFLTLYRMLYSTILVCVKPACVTPLFALPLRLLHKCALCQESHITVYDWRRMFGELFCGSTTSISTRQDILMTCKGAYESLSTYILPATAMSCDRRQELEQVFRKFVVNPVEDCFGIFGQKIPSLLALHFCSTYLQ